MGMAVNYSALFNADYKTTIQDALGNSGATATIDGKGALTITGTPSGAGLKIRAEQAGEANKKPSRDTISLSPAAQAYLTKEQVAVELLQGGRQAETASTNGAQKAASSSSSSTASTSVSAESSSSSETDLSDVSALAQEDPTQVIKDAVSSAEATFTSISTTEGFTAVARSNPDLIKDFASGFPDGLGDGFLAALKGGSVTVQTGAQVGYNVGGGISLTGTSMTDLGASATGIENVDLSKNNQVVADFGFGILAFTWPK